MMNISIYQRRRALLAARMQNGIAIVPTAPERPRNRDSHYPYRFDSYFYYLTGFREPGAVLVVIAGATPRSILFCRDKDPEREVWDGLRNGPAAACGIFGFDEAHSINNLDAQLPDLLADQSMVFGHLGADSAWDVRVLGWLNEVRSRVRTGVTAPHQINDVHVLLDEMRLVKDVAETVVMRTAVRCAQRGPDVLNTRLKRSCCTNSDYAARRRRLIRPLLRAAPTPVCCIMCKMTVCLPTAICC
jgi:Xaa-Pro aminopeptidase